jgi:hypothetical protein
MRRHLKSRFQIIRHESLNEIIANDVYFTNENQLKVLIMYKVLWNHLKNSVCYWYEY